MVKFGKRDSSLTRLIAVIVLPVSLLFVTYIVFAKDTPKIDKKETQEKRIDPIEELDISGNFVKEITGTASYYGKRFHRRRTANGERFDMYAPTAAHKKLPFGSILKVSNLHSGKATLVRINDRGPYIKRRVLDLSYGAAKEIEGVGLPKVKIETLLPGNDNPDGMDNYYFGYSVDGPLLCLPGEIISFADSTTKFEDAYEMVKKMRRNNSSAYLFIKADKLQRREKKNSDYRYYLAYINESGNNQMISDSAMLKREIYFANN